MTFDEKQKVEALESYSSVMALYNLLRGNPSAIKVKRAIARGGEVIAEALDFLIDTELKAGRVLNSPDYMQWLRLADTENYNLVPEENQIALGRTMGDRYVSPAPFAYLFSCWYPRRSGLFYLRSNLCYSHGVL